MFYRVKNVIFPMLAFAALTFTLQACGGGSTNNNTNNNNLDDVTAPTVKTASVDGAGLVDFTKNITIVFSENISAVDDDVLLHQGPANTRTPVITTVSVNNATLTVTASPALVAETDYHLVLKSTIKDSAGNKFAGSNYSFKTAAKGGGGQPGPKTITFIELNDLHANLVAHKELLRQTGAAKKILVSERGGLARIKTKIDEIRAANPNSILMNIGDTYHGGAEALFSNGNAIVKPVDALGIDVAVPGNWDFAFGPQVTNYRFGNLPSEGTVEVPSFQYLAANAFYKVPTFKVELTSDFKNAGPFRGSLMSQVFSTLKTDINQNATIDDTLLPPTMIKTIAGVRVGFIGITSDIVKAMHPLMALNLRFTQTKADYVTLIKGHASTLRDPAKGNVDYVAVMSELGIHKDLALAEVLSSTDVDIFFSAHTHELTKTQQKSSTGIIVVEAGNDTYLGQMDVDFDTNNKPVKHTWTIHEITSSITPNAQMQILVDAARQPYLNVTTPIEIEQIVLPNQTKPPFNPAISQKLLQSIDVPLGMTNVPLDRKNSLESTFNNVYTDMIRNFKNTNIGITPGFRFDAAVMPATPDYWEVEAAVTISGQVTVGDVYRFIPAPYYLVTGETTIGKIKRILEGGLSKTFSPDTFKHEGGWLFGYSGLNITVDLSKPFDQRVQKITADFTDNVVAKGTVLFDASLGQGNPAAAFPLGPNKILTATGCGRPFDLVGLVCSIPSFTNVVIVDDPNGVPDQFALNNAYAAPDFFIDNITLLLNQIAVPSARKSITDVSGTLMWPDSEYVQPLKGVGAVVATP